MSPLTVAGAGRHLDTVASPAGTGPGQVVQGTHPDMLARVESVRSRCREPHRAYIGYANEKSVFVRDGIATAVPLDGPARNRIAGCNLDVLTCLAVARDVRGLARLRIDRHI